MRGWKSLSVTQKMKKEMLNGSRGSEEEEEEEEWVRKRVAETEEDGERRGIRRTLAGNPRGGGR